MVWSVLPFLTHPNPCSSPPPVLTTRALRALFAPFGPFKFIPWDDDIDLSIDTSKSGGKVKVYSQYPVLV